MSRNYGDSALYNEWIWRAHDVGLGDGTRLADELLQRLWKSFDVRGETVHSDKCSLEDLGASPILFLTGDPGSGKTFEVRSYVLRSQQTRKYRTFSDLCDSDTFRDWLQQAFEADQELYVDAFDEKRAGFSLDSVLAPVAEARRENRCPRLRIVSRGAYLPRSLIVEIERIFEVPDKALVVFQLEDLTIDEIEKITEEVLGDDSSEFFQLIDDLKLRAYLRRPVDLISFAHAYRSEGSLGQTPTDAWLKAIEYELKESSLNRLNSSDLRPRSNLSQRLQMTQLLSALSYLCEESLEFDGQIESLTHSARWVEDIVKAVLLLSPSDDRALIADCLKESVATSLFECAGDTITFSSATKAQFLLARLMDQIPGSSLISIFKDHLRGTRVPDRAKPIMAELSKYNSIVFDWLCSNQPEVFLFGVVMDYSDSQKQAIVKALLSNFESRDAGNASSLPYAYLKFEGIEDCLRPYLSCEEGSEDDFYLALQITHACKVESLVDVLVHSATSSNMPYRLRSFCAYVASRLATTQLHLLAPLLNVSEVDDLNEDLFGEAISALWPSYFPPDSAFQIIRRPKSHYGAYKRFLSYDAHLSVDRIGTEYLLPGLRWVLRHSGWSHAHDDDFATLKSVLMELAWNNLDQPEVLALMARIIRARSRKHQAQFAFRDKSIYYNGPDVLKEADVWADYGKRKLIVEQWFKLRVNAEDSWDIVRLFLPNELDFLVETLLEQPIGDVLHFKWPVVRLYQKAISQDIFVSSETLDKMSRIGVDMEFIEEASVPVSEPVVSPRVREGHVESEFQSVFDRLLASGVDEDIVNLVWHMRIGMQGWAENSHRITDWQRWLALEEWKKELIIDKCALLAIRGPKKALPAAQRFRNAHEWCEMLVVELAWQQRGGDIRLSPDSLIAWVPYFVSWPSTISYEESAIHKVLVTNFPALIAAELQRQFLAGLRSKSESDPYIVAWGDEVGDELLWLCQKKPRNAKFINFVASLLVEHRYYDSETVILDLLRSRYITNVKHGVHLSIRHGSESVFAELDQVSQRLPEVLELLWKELWDTARFTDEMPLKSLGFKLLSTFFERACHLMPPSMDVPFFGGAVTKTYQRSKLRDGFAVAMSQLGSEEAWLYLSDAALRLDMPWLRTLAYRERTRVIQKAWMPPRFADIIRLCCDDELTFVATPGDLLQVVLKAFANKRSTIESQDVYWRQGERNSVYRPANEPAITSNVKSILESEIQKFVVNAEVNWEGGRPDMVVEAIIQEGVRYRRLKCVIEAKLCTSRDLPLGLRNQLASTYLDGAVEATGLFLVFWFERVQGCKCHARENLESEFRRDIAESNGRLHYLGLTLRPPGGRGSH